MGRVLFIILLALVIWGLLRNFIRRQAQAEARAAPARTAGGEDMVTCARCGVNMPRSEARAEGDRHVCRDNPRCVESR